MLTIVWPLAVAVIGFLLYMFAANKKLQDVGLVMFGCGMLWTVYLLTGSSFAIGEHHPAR
jgi:threonine/homoserine efflux transporter RhtA